MIDRVELGWVMVYNTIQGYDTCMQCWVILYCILLSTVLGHTVLSWVILYCTGSYCTELGHTVLYWVILYWAGSYCTVLYCTLYCTGLYCTILSTLHHTAHCIILHYTIHPALYYPPCIVLHYTIHITILIFKIHTLPSYAIGFKDSGHGVKNIWSRQHMGYWIIEEETLVETRLVTDDGSIHAPSIHPCMDRACMHCIALHCIERGWGGKALVEARGGQTP
jgi:hypothetical protein